MKLQKHLEQYKHFSILSYYFVIMALYNIYNELTVPKYIMYSRVDKYIPFVKEMVIPYLFWYLYIVFALIYLGFTSKKDFYNLSFFMFIGMTVCFVIYAILPNGQKLRPVIRGNDIFSRMIQCIYLLDRPTNSAPSMHVIDAIAVHIALVKCEALAKHFWIKLGSFITMILIICSTVMIKQHSILDVIYGILMCILLYFVVYKLDIVSHLIPRQIADHKEQIN